MKPTAVTVTEAKQMLDRGEGVVFVDARNPAAWGSSDVKLPGAVRIPVDEVQAHVAEVPGGRAAITYCT